MISKCLYIIAAFWFSANVVVVTDHYFPLVKLHGNSNEEWLLKKTKRMNYNCKKRTTENVFIRCKEINISIGKRMTNATKNNCQGKWQIFWIYIPKGSNVSIAFSRTEFCFRMKNEILSIFVTIHSQSYILKLFWTFHLFLRKILELLVLTLF